MSEAPPRRLVLLSRLASVLLSPAARGLLAVTAIFFLCWLAWQDRAQIGTVLVNANVPLLIFSIALGVLANYATGLQFQLFLRQHRIRLPLRTACMLQFLAQIAKYIPGKIWGSVLQAQVSGTARVGGFLLAGTDLAVFLILTLSGLGVALLVLTRSAPLAFGAVLLALILPAAFASQAWLANVSLRVSTTLGIRPPEVDDARPGPSLQEFLFATSIHSVIYLGSMMMLIAATTELDRNGLLLATASVLIAWVLGTLAFVFPSGIGVREVAFVFIGHFLRVPVEMDTLAAIAVVVRLAQVAQDLVTAVLLAPLLARSVSRSG